jgi:replication factor A1
MTESQQHIKDIKERLDKHLDLSEDDIREKFKELVNEFSVPPEEAKRAIINQYASEAGIDSNEVYSGTADEVVELQTIDTDEQWITVEAMVVELWEPRSDSIEQVGLFGDESGRMKFTKWKTSNLPELEEGQAYRLDNVVTDEFEGRFSVTLNKTTEITALDDDIDVGDGEVKVSGNIVNVQNGSGLIKRCSEEDCTRVLKNGRCSQHDQVEGELDLRLKTNFDDGKEVHDVLFGSEATEALTGLSLDESKDIAMDALDSNAPLEAMKPGFLGRYYTVTGPVVGDYLIVNGFEQTTEPRDATPVINKARSI